MDNSSTYVYYNDTVYLESAEAVDIFALLGVLVCLGGLVGNGLVLGLLGFSVKWEDFTMFIFHLSLADFLYLFSQTMFFMMIILAPFDSTWFHERYMTIPIFIFYWMGLCVLTTISIWCCLSVLCPIWCRLHAPQHAPAAVCTLIWVVSISVNVHCFLLCLVHKFHDQPSCEVHIVLWFVLSCVLLSVTAMCILIVQVKVRCSTQCRSPLRFYITMLLTVLFVLCTFPFGILIQFFHNIEKFFWINLLLLLSCVISSANPLVYYFVGRMGGVGMGRTYGRFSRRLWGRSQPRKENVPAEHQQFSVRKEEGHSPDFCSDPTLLTGPLPLPPLHRTHLPLSVS